MPSPVDTAVPTPLLGGLSPAQFMRRHWQKKPLLVRQALPGLAAPVTRAELFALAAREEVEARLVRQDGGRWSLRRGPLPRRALPPVSRPGWTLLVQGLDRHVAAAHELLTRFRFLPAARLDDLMLSWASDGGGVGPHVDSYDVFLVQVQGQRRWRVAPPGDDALQPGLPLKILAHFEPAQEWVLEPGDLLYLPPGWGHDGVAVGECMTASVGFRAPARDEIAHALLARLLDTAPETPGPLYRDAAQPATATPAAIPAALRRFAAAAVRRAASDARSLDVVLGELLTEPDGRVCFEANPQDATPAGGVRLAAASRMLYDGAHIYLNGESWRAAGRDATLMRRLADQRTLGPKDVAGASAAALALLQQWLDDGWLLPAGDGDGGRNGRHAPGHRR